VPVKNLHAVVAQIRHVYLVFVYGKTGRPVAGELPVSRAGRAPLAQVATATVEDLYPFVAGIRHVYLVTMHGNTDHHVELSVSVASRAPLTEEHLIPGHNNTSRSKRADILTHSDGPSVQARQVSSAISQEL
jgi:hypothetical protein